MKIPKNCIDITGQRYSRLVAISLTSTKPIKWRFRCDCGTMKICRANDVKSGRTRSCGCLISEITTSRNKIHGMRHSTEYNSWRAMKERCLNINNKEFKNYGARGISVCNRWDKFENFIYDMGEKPTVKHTIDRADNESGYNPCNCYWANSKKQANNRRNNFLIEYKGQVKTAAQWGVITGTDASAIRKRIGRGWSINDAFFYSNRRKEKITQYQTLFQSHWLSIRSYRPCGLIGLGQPS